MGTNSVVDATQKATERGIAKEITVCAITRFQKKIVIFVPIYYNYEERKKVLATLGKDRY